MTSVPDRSRARRALVIAALTLAIQNGVVMAFAVLSLVSLAGRLATGWLSDRVGRALTLTVAYGSAALGIACVTALALAGQWFWLVLYVALYGMAQGSTGIIGSARAADVFAGASFGAIYGWLVLSVGPSQAFGAWVGGRIFDVTGSYLPAFAFAVAALGVGVIAIWRVRDTRPREERA